MNELNEKFIEVIKSVLPITLIVLFLHFTFVNLEINTLLSFIAGTVLVIIGLTIFLFGIDQGLAPIGHGAGSAITTINSYLIIILFCLVLGFFISYAEPDLHILAKQVNMVTAG